MNEEIEKTSEVYANSITVTNTFFDFSLIFKKETITQSPDGEQSTQTDEVSFVRISPQLAKALSKLLQDNVAQYESTFGNIPDFQSEGK